MQYLKVWNTDGDKHHKKWQDTEIKGIMTWLYPENRKLKKTYNDKIHDDHLEELNNAHWNKKKVRILSFF